MSSKTIDDYEFGPTLGRGSFGEVKVAINIYTDQEVAIKIIEKTGIASEEDRHQLREEIRILSLLQHRNVVRLYDVIETASYAYIVLELIEGKELFEHLVDHKRLDEDEARRLFHQIIDGIEHCHQRKVAHRDLKLENILLDRENNIKIIDFGLAAEIHVGERLTKACGSLQYAAPEIFSESRCGYEGPEVDVWSCGVVLFALLCGRLPFVGDTQPALEEAIVKGHFTLPDFVSYEAQNLLARMLTKDQALRITIPEIRESAWFQGGLSHGTLGQKASQVAVQASAASSPVSDLLSTAFVLFELGRPPKEKRGGWVRDSTAASVKSWRSSFGGCSSGRRVRYRSACPVDPTPISASPMPPPLRRKPSSASEEQVQALPSPSPAPLSLAPDLLTPDFVLFELGRPPKPKKNRGGWVSDTTEVPHRPSKGSGGGYLLSRRTATRTSHSVEASPPPTSSMLASPRKPSPVPSLPVPGLLMPNVLTTDFVLSELGHGEPLVEKGGWVRSSTAVPHRPRRGSYGGRSGGRKLTLRVPNPIDSST